ncbi:MAG: pyridoxal phosphate-dependent aminotransferase [Promethearchaeota archaeon]
MDEKREKIVSRQNPILSRVSYPPIQEIKAYARKKEQIGLQTIDLSQGQSNFPTPHFIRESVANALTDPEMEDLWIGYSPGLGLFQLREKIAEKVYKENNLSVDPETEILITNGGSTAAFTAALTITSAHEQNILIAPFYFCYERILQIIGREACEFPLELSRSQARVDFEKLERQISPKTATLWITSPSNPTGKCFSENELRKVVDLCINNESYLIFDEVYSSLIYNENKHVNPATFDEEAAQHIVSIGSVSKNFAMAGWRIGWIIAPSELITNFMKYQDNAVICAPVPSQIGALSAFTHETQLPNYLKEYQKRRDLVQKRIDEIEEIWCPPMEGAIFSLVFFEKEKESRSLAFDLVKETGVITVPGDIFGKCANSALRICYGSANSEQLNSAFDLIEKFIQKRRKSNK